MFNEYNPKIVEKKIQDKWNKSDKYKSEVDNREKFYCLSMFPLRR